MNVTKSFTLGQSQTNICVRICFSEIWQHDSIYRSGQEKDIRIFNWGKYKDVQSFAVTVVEIEFEEIEFVVEIEFVEIDFVVEIEFVVEIQFVEIEFVVEIDFVVEIEF